MIQRSLFFFVCLLVSAYFSQGVKAQQIYTLMGQVLDASNGEALEGVNVVLSGKVRAISKEDGSFVLQLSYGSHIVDFTSVGYLKNSQRIWIDSDDSLVVNLQSGISELREVSVTASRYERNLMEETAPVEILSSELIFNVNAVRLFEAIDKVPGITVTDGQVNIRNGSGFAYGAGSRTMFIVDDQPLLTPDRNDIRWNFIPVEMIDQVEVVKTAGSAQYGSGALNGMIHVRTFWPQKESETRLQTFYNYVGQPRRQELAWWDSAPYEAGIGVAHGQKIGDFDLVAGVNYMNTRSFIKNGDQMQKRFTWKSRWKPQKLQGVELRLHAGYMDSEEADYLVWDNADEGAYIPLRGNNPSADNGLVRIDRRQWYVAPVAEYAGPNANRHILRARHQRLEFLNFTQNLQTNLLSMEYQWHTILGPSVSMQSGLQYQSFDVDDPLGIGIHQGVTYSAFGQWNWRQGRFNSDLGLRVEHFNITGLQERTAPVLRLATNYRMGPSTHMRASFGQGYRFPSMSEIFISKPDEAIPIFPNPGLRPEYGWTAEWGVKKEITVQQWKSFADFSLFMMDYTDMTDFVFGYYLPDSIENPTVEQVTRYAGFSARNVNRARIGGWEFSFSSAGQISKMPLRILAGYTYSYPVDLNRDTQLFNFFRFWGNVFESAVRRESRLIRPMLPYRNRHLIKADIETGIGPWLFGVDYRYYSRIERMDDLIVQNIPGLPQYLEARSGNEFVLNLRMSWQHQKAGQISLIANNVLNREYSLRFARMEPPRNYTIQYRMNF
jgi:outer membrane receptor protein involved in Fe transport